jgi:hypothetical protein
VHEPEDPSRASSWAKSQLRATSDALVGDRYHSPAGPRQLREDRTAGRGAPRAWSVATLSVATLTPTARGDLPLRTCVKECVVAEKYEGYCVKCKEKREFDGEVSVSESGRRMAKGTCPVCGTKMNRILGKA